MREAVLAVVLSVLFLIAPFPSRGSEGNRNEAGRPEPAGRIAITAKEQAAVAASIAGTVVTRSRKDFRIEATPEKSDARGCLSVKVVSEAPRWKEVNSYLVCDGLIAGEESATGDEVEPDFESFVAEMSRHARTYGLAQGIFQGVRVKAAVLPQEPCTIEVNIFKGAEHVKRIVSACP